METTLKLSPPLQARTRRALRIFAQAAFQRLVFGALVLFVIAYLGYFGLQMARGIPFQPASMQAAESTLKYVGKLLSGDLGLTTAGSISLRPVEIAELLPTILARSLGLLFTSVLIAATLGVIFGIWASGRRHSRWPLITILASIVGVSVPSFFAAVLLQIGVIQLTRLTGRTILPAGGFGWDEHLLLPALVLAARPLAQITRVTFVTLNDILDQDYVRTAYSKGLGDRLVMDRHILRNALMPVLTTIGISLRFSLSSLPVVEFFFGWQGVGFTLLKSISQEDDNLTVALLLCLGLLFIIINLLLDLSYKLIDPRLRGVQEAGKSRDSQKLGERLRAALGDLWKWLRGNPLQDWIQNRRKPAPPSPFRSVLDERGEPEDQSLENGRLGERRAWKQGTLGNPALLVGSLLVMGLLAVILLGPQLAPHSPYTTQGIKYEGGEFSVPPFPPNELYPWGTDVLGRDMMSLILAGAQQTMLLTTLVVLARMTLGFGLGAVAGWFHGGPVDKALVRAAEVISAFPTLLLAMTLILALGIRNGMQPFIIALCFVGWGETMQYVRSEVMSIRPRLFIESAIALGRRTPGIIFRHVLPNLIPALISIAALEMGAVLMLLGELGFIGIFIGGGAFAELDAFGAPFHYSDVPEWGALLSNLRPYARSYPWTAIYPSLAFFIAILGFNLFGEGMRNLVEAVGVRIMRLLNRYTVAAGLIVVAGFVYLRGTTGALAYYQRQADAFDVQRAMETLRMLTNPALQGRSLGSTGIQASAEQIAEEFDTLGIQAAGDNMTYFQSRARSYENLDTLPTLRIDDQGEALVYDQDFVEYPSTSQNLGTASGSIKVVSVGELTIVGNMFRSTPAVAYKDYYGEILLLLTDRDLQVLWGVNRSGALVVVPDEQLLKRHYTMGNMWSNINLTRTGHLGPAPTLYISEAVANRILLPTGKTVAELRRDVEELSIDEVYELPVPTRVSMEIQGTTVDKFVANHVIGHLPGTSAQLDQKMIIVMAQYDSPPLLPAEPPYHQAANDNASGVAVMLEAIRAIKASGYQPYKTFLFIAYSGEGYEGGRSVNPEEVSKFLQTKFGFSENFEIEAIIQLRGLGSSAGEKLVLQTGGSLRLANLFESAARRVGTPVERAGGDVDISVVFEERSFQAGGEEAPSIGLTWEGWWQTSRSAEDNLETISIEHLEASGKALSLALMVLGRETQY